MESVIVWRCKPKMQLLRYGYVSETYHGGAETRRNRKRLMSFEPAGQVETGMTKRVWRQHECLAGVPVPHDHEDNSFT